MRHDLATGERRSTEINIMMPRVILCGLVAALGSLAWSPSASAASFDCTKASTRAERLICSTPELSVRDEIVARLFKAAAARDPAGDVRRAQRKWISDEQQPCADVQCLRDAYDDRFTTLAPDAPTSLVQRFVRKGDTGELDIVQVGEWVYFTVNAVWDDGRPGAVYSGEATGLAKLAGGQVHYVVDDDCALTLTPTPNGPWRIREQGCEASWGLNVTLAGAYSKKP